ncbi:uncharacterized protein ACMZJ9_011665 [Mantella aurantiaca]
MASNSKVVMLEAQRLCRILEFSNEQHGLQHCRNCHSTKYETCDGCAGRGQILNYMQLTVTWRNHIYGLIVEHNSEFPTDLFRTVNGKKVFTDEQIRLRRAMDQTSPEAPASSPVKPQAAVSPLLIQSDFVEVDLNSPRPPPKVDLELFPPVVAGDLAIPLRNLCPSGSYNGARGAQPSADANPASNPQLPKLEKPSTSSRRSNNVGSSKPALAPSALPLSTSITAAPSQPGVDPSWGQGQDPMGTHPSNPPGAPSALHLSTSITAAPSEPGVDPSGGQRRDPMGTHPSNPPGAPSVLHLSTSVTAAPSQPGVDPSWGEGRDPMGTCPSYPAVAPSALHLSTSITAAASQPGVDPSGGQGRDPIGVRPSNPAVAPSVFHLSNSITAAPWGQGQGPMVTCTDGVKSLPRPRDTAMANTAVSCPADIDIRQVHGVHIIEYMVLN